STGGGANQVVIQSDGNAANAITLTASDAAGGITATVGTGNFSVVGGATSMNGVNIYAGAENPPAFPAPIGSLYLSTNGNGYINKTDAASDWHAITVAP